MSVALLGWIAAFLGLAATLSLWRAGGARMEAVARACHELRGPLTAARLGLQLGGRLGELSPERLRAIDLELGRAALALEDLADLRRSARAALVAFGPQSRTRAREGAPAAVGDLVSARRLLSDSVAAWEPAAAASGAGLSLRWDGPDCLIRGERLRLARATGNLIANAIEHGGGAVAVRGSCTGPGGVRIEVTDDGPGLHAPVAALSGRRHRGRGERGRGERGRGLAIASAVALAHGGRLSAAPSTRGARLVLELPAASVAHAEAPAETLA